MLRRRTPTRYFLLLASLSACIFLAACGDDDASDPESDDTSPDAVAGTADDTPAEPEGSGDDSADSTNDETAMSGTVTVDGVTYAFSPSICLPDDAAGSSVSGSGSADDGSEIYVDMAAGNLSIYVGAEDPLSADPDYVASSVSGQGSLDETVDGSTVSAEASFTEHAAMDVVAEGALEVTC